MVENDLEVAPGFLKYMNAALYRYESEPRVMLVSGCQFPVEQSRQSPVFLSFTTSGGWGTWQRAWKQFDMQAPAFEMLHDDVHLRRAFDLDGCYPYFRMLRRNLEKPFPNWDIVFYSNVFMKRGLALHPHSSLMRNNGFDGSGSNCENFAKARVEFEQPAEYPEFPRSVEIDHLALAVIKKHLRFESRPLVKLGRRHVFKIAGVIKPAIGKAERSRRWSKGMASTWV